MEIERALPFVVTDAGIRPCPRMGRPSSIRGGRSRRRFHPARRAARAASRGSAAPFCAYAPSTTASLLPRHSLVRSSLRTRLYRIGDEAALSPARRMTRSRARTCRPRDRGRGRPPQPPIRSSGFPAQVRGAWFDFPGGPAFSAAFSAGLEGAQRLREVSSPAWRASSAPRPRGFATCSCPRSHGVRSEPLS